MSKDQWQWRLDTRRWQGLLPGVAVTHSGPVSPEQRAWAAVLFAGSGAYVTADAALRAHGMALPEPKTVHVVTGLSRQVASRADDADQVHVGAHRCRQIGMWTHPARTPPVLRVAPAVIHAAWLADSDRAAEWRIAAAVQQRLVRPDDLRVALAQMPRIPRRPLIRTVLDDVELGAHAASELDFLRFLRRHGLPRPDRLQRPVRIGTLRYLDAWWERQRVTVELDGAHHRMVRTWDGDTLRGNDVVLAERHDRLLLLRLTGGNLRHDEQRVVAQLRAALL